MVSGTTATPCPWDDLPSSTLPRGHLGSPFQLSGTPEISQSLWPDCCQGPCTFGQFWNILSSWREQSIPFSCESPSPPHTHSHSAPQAWHTRICSRETQKPRGVCPRVTAGARLWSMVSGALKRREQRCKVTQTKASVLTGLASQASRALQSSRLRVCLPSCAEREEGVCAELLLALSRALLSCCLMRTKL